MLSGTLQGGSALHKEWPSAPVLILGARGSGRRTWANQLMAFHQAAPSFTWRSEDDRSFSMTDARYLATDYFRLRTRKPRWASICLDDASEAAQNALLKITEEPPAHGRLILRAPVQGVLPTIKSRCHIVTLVPGTPSDEVGVLVTLGVDEGDAEALVEARPGRPGAAFALASTLPARERLEGLLTAAEARDKHAVSQGMIGEFDAIGVRTWLVEWVDAARANRPDSHPVLAEESRYELQGIAAVLRGVASPRLAVRTALLRLAER